MAEGVGFIDCHEFGQWKSGHHDVLIEDRGNRGWRDVIPLCD